MFDAFKYTKKVASKATSPLPVLPTTSSSKSPNNNKRKATTALLGSTRLQPSKENGNALADKYKEEDLKTEEIHQKQGAGAAGGGLPEKGLSNGIPLRLIIIGHNPSQTAWTQGHYYANPSNWMWRILKDTGLAPPPIQGPQHDSLLPDLAGIGFTDVGHGVPGTDSSKFTSQHFTAWRQPFFNRLQTHLEGVNEKLGCTCGKCGAPRVVAFSGKRQFAELFQSGAGSSAAGAGAPRGGGGQKSRSKSVQQVGAAAEEEGGGGGSVEIPSINNTANNPKNFLESNNTHTNNDALIEETSQQQQPPPEEENLVRLQRSKPAKIEVGRQWVLPMGWPLPVESTEVWVMTSTSGAAPMTRQQRYAPWEVLAERLCQEPWPDRKAHCACVQ